MPEGSSARRPAREAGRWLSAPPPDCAVGSTIDKGHRLIETGEFPANSETADYLDRPGVAQAARIRRIRELTGRSSHETVYVITRLTRKQFLPVALLALDLHHWCIEKGLDW